MKKKSLGIITVGLILMVMLVIGLACAPEEPVERSYSCTVYTEQGCDKYVVASGGEIEIQSGGTLDVQTGASVASVLDSVIKTADYTLTAGESGGVASNQGATAEITFTLPSAAAGLNYCIYVSAAYTVNVDPGSADQVHHLTNAAGDRIQNTGTAGDSVCLQANDATYWIPLQEIGTWSDAD